MFNPPAGDANTELDTASFRFDLLVLEVLLLKSTLLASFFDSPPPAGDLASSLAFGFRGPPARPCAEPVSGPRVPVRGELDSSLEIDPDRSLQGRSDFSADRP